MRLVCSCWASESPWHRFGQTQTQEKGTIQSTKSEVGWQAPDPKDRICNLPERWEQEGQEQPDTGTLAEALIHRAGLSDSSSLETAVDGGVRKGENVWTSLSVV